jgi:arginase
MSETNMTLPLNRKPSRVYVYGIPLDLGQSRRGVDMGPSAIRNANLHTILKNLDIEIVDGGDAETKVPEALEPDPTPPFDEASAEVDMDQTSPQRMSVPEAAAWLEVS